MFIIIMNRKGYRNMAQHNPAITYTLQDFINMRNIDDMTYYNFSILEVINGVEHLDHNLVEDYLPHLLNVCETVSLSDEEYKKYKYCPDLLAYDLYGSVQLDFVILLLNDMIDPKEFNIKTVKLPYSSGLSVFLNDIYTKESSYINKNRADNNLYR